MRHFLPSAAPGAVAGLPRGVLPAARARVLVAIAGLAQRASAGASGAGARAVPIPAIAMAAQEEDLLAVGAPANDESERVHRLPRAGGRDGQSPRGMRRKRPLQSRPRFGSEGPEWLRLRALTPQALSPATDLPQLTPTRNPASRRGLPVRNSALLGDRRHGAQGARRRRAASVTPQRWRPRASGVLATPLQYTSMAGFAGGWPHRPGGRTATPAALR